MIPPCRICSSAVNVARDLPASCRGGCSPISLGDARVLISSCATGKTTPRLDVQTTVAAVLLILKLTLYSKNCGGHCQPPTTPVNLTIVRTAGLLAIDDLDGVLIQRRAHTQKPFRSSRTGSDFLLTVKANKENPASPDRRAVPLLPKSLHSNGFERSHGRDTTWIPHGQTSLLTHQRAWRHSWVVELVVKQASWQSSLHRHLFPHQPAHHAKSPAATGETAGALKLGYGSR